MGGEVHYDQESREKKNQEKGRRGDTEMKRGRARLLYGEVRKEKGLKGATK